MRNIIYFLIFLPFSSFATWTNLVDGQMVPCDKPVTFYQELAQCPGNCKQIPAGENYCDLKYVSGSSFSIDQEKKTARLAAEKEIEDAKKARIEKMKNEDFDSINSVPELKEAVKNIYKQLNLKDEL